MTQYPFELAMLTVLFTNRKLPIADTLVSIVDFWQQ